MALCKSKPFIKQSTWVSHVKVVLNPYSILNNFNPDHSRKCRFFSSITFFLQLNPPVTEPFSSAYLFDPLVLLFMTSMSAQKGEGELGRGGGKGRGHIYNTPSPPLPRPHCQACASNFSARSDICNQSGINEQASPLMVTKTQHLKKACSLK